MSLVLTLIVNPLETDISPVIDHIEDYLGHDGATVYGKEILSPGEAVDIYFNGYDLAAAKNMIDAALVMFTVDYAIQYKRDRIKKLLLADMDSTMITVECIDELADFAGIKDQVAAVTEQAMRGELDFEEALHSRVALLEGLDESALQQCYDQRVELTPGARTLVQTMTANGAYTALVSGGFTFFTSRVKDAVGFSEHTSNVLEIVDGKLTGKVVPPVCDATTKLKTLLALRTRRLLNARDVIAVGDGANDIPMMQEAGMGVAYHAKTVASRAADFAVHHGDLTALLFIQGYRREEFVS